MSVSITALIGSFLGSMVGTIYCIRLGTRHLWKLVNEDTDMKKIEVHVTMVAPDA